MNFPVWATVITLLVAIICFYPLFKKQAKIKTNQRDSLNKAFYFDRLKEIEQDEQQGLLENASQLKTELQQSLLQDIPNQQNEIADNKSYGKIWFVSGTLILAIMATVTYFNVGAWQMEQMFAKSYEKLPYFYQRLEQEETNPLTDQEMQQFATALRMKLQTDPNDAKDWWLLGQIGMALGNAQMAYDSYGKAVALSPENLDYKIAYARILNNSEDAQDNELANQLLREVLRKDHKNMEALSLLALQYFEKEDYKLAAVTWAMMLRMMPEDDNRRPLIEKSIKAAKDALEEKEQRDGKAISTENGTMQDNQDSKEEPKK